MKSDEEIRKKLEEIEETQYNNIDENIAAGSIIATLRWVLGE